jgi:hypothetical protein
MTESIPFPPPHPDVGKDPSKKKTAIRYKRIRDRNEAAVIGDEHFPRAYSNGKRTSLSSLTHALPKHLVEIAEAVTHDPNILALDQSIAVLDARTIELLHGLQRDAAGKQAWRDLQRKVSELRDGVRRETSVGAQLRLIEEIDDLMDEQLRVISVWQEVYQTLDQRRKMVETETKRREKMSSLVTADQVIVLVHRVAQVIKRKVKDPAVVREIGVELAAMVQGQHRGQVSQDMPDAYDILEEQIAEGIVPDPRTVTRTEGYDNRGPNWVDPDRVAPAGDDDDDEDMIDV